MFGSAIALLAAGCSNAQQASNQTDSQPQGALNNASSSMANMPGMQGHGTASSTGMGMRNLPAGSKPFFGTIASVSGSQITVSGFSRTSSSTVSTIVDITSGTQFQGGAQSALVTGAKVAGYGTANSDGSINATNVQINPTFGGRGQGGGHYQGGGQGSGSNQPQSPQ